MNYGRILLGGLVGGVVFNVVSFALELGVLMERYAVLQGMGFFRKEPRLPFIFLWMVALFLVSIGLVWLYAAARPRFGPGPGTAVCVGLVAGLIATIPPSLVTYSWTYTGGCVTGLWALETVVGSIAATLAGGWLYKE